VAAATVHVFGAAGFAGAQLAALIDRHPALELGVITARGDAGRRLVDVAPEHRVTRVLEEPDVGAVGPGDLVAVAYPHAEAAALVSELVDRGARVLDVSADHRLRDPALYPAVYGFAHPRPDLLAEAVYGLPELYREAIRAARVVANPGCYPEASLLALLPLRGAIADVVIDSKSGVSGAGRTPSATVHYSHATDNVTPYKVYSHRHAPEIEQELGLPVTFTPHLVPVDRGLLSTCYARLTDGALHPDDLLDAYRAFYAGHPFVEVVEAPPGMRAVQRTNYAQVHPVADPRGGRVTAFGVIDNLGKGAAGQAVQNLNLMAGRPETEGLV
jgi:N-acetyl-gamma-glutamyl-phosphate reductase